MATRKKKASKGTSRRGSSGGGNPNNDGRITEAQHDEAMRVLRAEYHQGVKALVDEIDNQIKDAAEHGDNRDVSDIVHQVVDGSYWVIYTHANFQVLMCSDHHDAYTEEFGQAPVEGDGVNWGAAAFAALEQDVRERMDMDGVGADLEEAPRRDRAVYEAPRRGGSHGRGPRGLRRG